MADAFDAQFITISAVLGGVKDIREAVEQAQIAQGTELENASGAGGGRRTIVFVDEVHRFNKSQQDAFLPHVESGLFTFIGATTENPSFEVNSALLSRAAVYVLQPLAEADLQQIVAKAQGIDAVPAIEQAALDRLIAYADGDARRLLNTLETLAVAARQGEDRGDRPTPGCSRCWASACAATTRAASSSTTPSARCTSRCAAPTPTPRCTGSCACSMVAPTRATWRAA